MNNISLMDEFKAMTNTCSKKSNLLLCKFMLFANVISEIPAWHQVHDQVQSIPVLECLSHVDKELVFQVS